MREAVDAKEARIVDACAGSIRRDQRRSSKIPETRPSFSGISLCLKRIEAYAVGWIRVDASAPYPSMDTYYRATMPKYYNNRIERNRGD